MKKVESVNDEVKVVSIGLSIAVAVACFLLQGCAVPMLLGVKSYQSGDTKIDFITGADLTLGMNGIDSVANSRGIEPEQRGVTRRVRNSE